MLGNVLFVFYMIMCFTGLLGLVLIRTLMRHGQRRGEKLIFAGRSFMMADLLVGLFYFYTYYREMVLGQFHDGMVLRGIDAIQFYVIALAWLRFIDTAAGGEGESQEVCAGSLQAGRGPLWRKVTYAVFAGLMVCSLLAYLCLLDGYYQPLYANSQIAMLAVEAALSVSVIAFTAGYVRYCFGRLQDPFERRYILIVSILLNFNNVWNSAAVMVSLRRQLGESILSSYLYAVTAAVLLAVNLLTILFFYRRDFSPIFYAKAGGGEEEKMDPHDPVTQDQALQLLAEEYGLTQREKEVLDLAYQGMTNPEIAEALVISPHTVKRHMHNLFAKLQIQARMELVHLVSERIRK